ncbi:sugar transferase [Brevibacterium casei]|uniref:sugar transferase n=1 Tax=Brevibacterium casei TaxID=33889 RepID=UPI00223BECCA|nr:sugar transferase [Brevibacterium casei]MCT1550173.1 sugar transferase [Brevibacterium casei]
MSRRRLILAVALQVIATGAAVVIVYSLTHGPAAAWILAWSLFDMLIGGVGATGRSARALRIPILSALVVTGVFAFIATFTAMDAAIPALIVPDDSRFVFLIGLWSVVCATALIRVAVPVIVPTRRLRIVAEPGDRPSGVVAELVVSPRIASDAEALGAAVVAEVEGQDIEFVELTFDLDPEALRQLSWALREKDIELYLPTVDLGFDPARVRASSSFNSTGLLIGPARPRLLERCAKKLFDYIVASVLVLIAAPLLLVTAIAIKISMPGPVFYTQTRIGLNGRRFEIIKFRSMIVDADAQLTELLSTQGSAAAPLFKVEDDPRVTRLGHLLRRSSIDELPQLFNVLGGSMSLVGPRPQRDGEVALYQGTDHHRLGVRPGMTGLWQVSGRSDLPWDQAREFDLFYAHNWSLKNDLTILLRTFGAVIRGAGAQ